MKGSYWPVCNDTALCRHSSKRILCPAERTCSLVVIRKVLAGSRDYCAHTAHNSGKILYAFGSGSCMQLERWTLTCMLKQCSCMRIRLCTAGAHPLLLYGGGGGGGGGGEGLLLMEELLDLQAPQSQLMHNTDFGPFQ